MEESILIYTRFCRIYQFVMMNKHVTETTHESFCDATANTSIQHVQQSWSTHQKSNMPMNIKQDVRLRRLCIRIARRVGDEIRIRVGQRFREWPPRGVGTRPAPDPLMSSSRDVPQYVSSVEHPTLECSTWTGHR